MTAESSFYVKNRGQVTGPAPLGTLREQVRRGLLTPVHKLSADGENWFFARELPELFPASAGSTAPPAAPQGGQPSISASAEAAPERTLLENPVVRPGGDGPEPTAVYEGTGSPAANPPVSAASSGMRGGTQPPDDTTWQVMLDGREYGPFTTQQMAANIAEGRLTPLMMVWRSGMPEWVPAQSQFSFPSATSNQASGATLPPIKVPHVALGMAVLGLVLSLPLAADRDWLGDGRIVIGLLVSGLGGGAILLALREFNPQGRAVEDRLRHAALWVAFAAAALGCLGAR